MDLRSYARALAGVREADVRRELLMGLAERNGSIPPADRERLDELLEDACIGTRAALHRHRGEPGWAALWAALERDAGSEALFADRGATLARVLGLVVRAWRRPVQLLKSGPATAEELHELRLALKHCRYALEPVADVAPKATARLLRRLRAAQDSIGEHRDAVLAEHWVRSKERQLGRDFATRLGGELKARERILRRRAARRSEEVLEAWAAWQAGTRRLRKESTPDRA
jgi:CHAD domain-containing protein